MIMLFSLCVGLLNAGRGSGIAHMKWPVLLSMALFAYIVNPTLWYVALCPVPLAASWWIPGGTGLYMPWVVDKLSFLGLKDLTWRFFEFAAPCLYMVVYLIAA